MPAESANLEFKAALDMTDTASRLKLVREIVAFANSGGGEVRVGVRDDGLVVGVDEPCRRSLDPAKVADLLSKFTAPDHVEVVVHLEDAGEGRHVVRLVVAPSPEPPVVIAIDGNFEGTKKQESAFRRGDVYVRRGTKAERAAREDYRRWRREAQDAIRNEILDRVTMVVEAPVGSRVELVDDEGTGPLAQLARSARIWSEGTSRLLTSRELLELLVASQDLVATPGQVEFIVHSALRRKATLWHWLAILNPSKELLSRILTEATNASDRDSSDAGRSIVEVGAAYLSAKEYRVLLDCLSKSRYAHFREAAVDGADMRSVVSKLKLSADPLVGDALREAVRGQCERLLQADRMNSAGSRQLSALGLAEAREAGVGPWRQSHGARGVGRRRERLVKQRP